MKAHQVVEEYLMGQLELFRFLILLVIGFKGRLGEYDSDHYLINPSKIQSFHSQSQLFLNYLPLFNVYLKLIIKFKFEVQF